MATITISLEAAGLAHAKGKSDGCNGEHDVDMLSVLDVDSPDWLPADGLAAVLQMLHEQAHPEGTAYWESCRERGCADAAEVYDGRELFK